MYVSIQTSGDTVISSLLATGVVRIHTSMGGNPIYPLWSDSNHLHGNATFGADEFHQLASRYVIQELRATAEDSTK